MNIGARTACWAGGGEPKIPNAHLRVNAGWDGAMFRTDYIPKFDDRIEVCMTPSKESGSIFGVNDGLFRNGSITIYAPQVWYGNQSLDVGFNYDTSNKSVYGFDAGRFYINETTKHQFTPLSGFAANHLVIFGISSSDSGTKMYGLSGAFYWAKAWREGKLIKCWIPDPTTNSYGCASIKEAIGETLYTPENHGYTYIED